MRGGRDADALLLELVAILSEGGVELARASLNLTTLHPEVVGRAFLWQGQEVRSLLLPHGETSSQAFLTSPIRAVFEGSGTLHRPLDGSVAMDFPILSTLAASGLTDYLVVPLMFSDGSVHAATFASRTPGGFGPGQRTFIDEVCGPASAILEVLEARRLSRTLLETYLGVRTADQVLRGRIRRGDVERIDAVLWYSDLRDFTSFSERETPEQILELLAASSDHAVKRISAHGGEVLKFIGDALLAIFPVDPDPTVAPNRALTAATECLVALQGENLSRSRRHLAPIRIGISLHQGEVLYGNMGSTNRLDFTVLGPAVNLVSRIDGLCRDLGEPLLMSSTLARLSAAPTLSRGTHRLKGLKNPEEVFALDWDRW